jgi:general secretion pathway protein L
MARRVLGLDIGSHSVKAVELRQALGREVEVGQLRSFAVDDPAPALATELRHLFAAHDLPTQHVIVSIPGDHLSTRRLHFPFKDRRRLAAAVPFEVEQQVPFDLAEFIVDWDVAGESAGGADVTACLVQRAEATLLVETLAEAGLSPRAIEAEGLVLSNLAALLELPGLRVLADLGHRKSSFSLCRDGRVIATRTVPIAGRALTQAIAQERGLGELEAERAKVEEGVIGNRAAAQAVAVLDRLARELARTLGSFEPLIAGGERVERVHLLGGSAHLAGLDGYLAERTGLAVERLPLPRGAVGTGFVAAGDTLLFAPAMALALRGTSKATTRINLRQGNLAERIDLRGIARDLRPSALYAGGFLAAAGIACAVEIWTHSRSASALEGASRALVAEATGGRDPGDDPLEAMQAALRSVQRRADTLGVYQGNLSALDLLTEISAHVPKDLDVVFEEVTIERGSVLIKGHSPSFGSVDRLRDELARHPTFTEISVGDITTDARRSGQTFSVRIRVSAEEAT